MSFIFMLMKCARGYKFIKKQENINPFMYMDDIKLFTKNEKEILNKSLENKYLGREFGQEKIVMLIMRSGKKRNGRKRTAKSRKNQNALRKRKFQVIVNIGSGHPQISSNERYHNKRELQTRRTRKERRVLSPCQRTKNFSKG